MPGAPGSRTGRGDRHGGGVGRPSAAQRAEAPQSACQRGRARCRALRIPDLRRERGCQRAEDLRCRATLPAYLGVPGLLYQMAKRGLRIGEGVRQARERGPRNLEPASDPVVIRQQPCLDGAYGEPKAEARRRSMHEPRDDRAGARLRVEIPQHKDAAAMLRGDQEPRNPLVERVLPPWPARREVVRSRLTADRSDQAARDGGIDWPFAAIVNRQRHSTIPAGRCPRAASAAAPLGRAAIRPSPPDP